MTEPDVTLDPFEHIFCPVHGEPFRAQYPKGIAVSTIKLFQAASEVDEVWERARELTGEETPDVATLPAVLAERRACCRVEPAALKKVYRQSGIGCTGICEVCRLFKVGTRYSVTMAGRATKDLSHVCFDCIVDRFRPAEDVDGGG